MDSLPSKRCTRCHQIKPLLAYRKAAKERDGLQDCCRDCMREKWAAGAHKRPAPSQTAAAAARWRARHPDLNVQRAREFRKRNAARLYEKNRKQAARRRGLSIVPFTMEQLAAKLAYWANRCWMCGAPATCIDHVKPQAKGGAHVLANLRPACHPCNSRKLARWPFVLVRNIPDWG